MMRKGTVCQGGLTCMASRLSPTNRTHEMSTQYVRTDRRNRSRDIGSTSSPTANDGIVTQSCEVVMSDLPELATMRSYMHVVARGSVLLPTLSRLLVGGLLTLAAVLLLPLTAEAHALVIRSEP